MRLISVVICLCLTVSIAKGQDFINAEAKAAKEQFEKDIEAARKKYADSLEEAAKNALEKDQLEEAIKIKQVVENLRTGKSPDEKTGPVRRVLWKHRGGYFERLNDGYWIERVPDGVAHIFAQGAVKEEYIEISRATASKAIVRLYDNRSTVSFQGKGFRPLYKGGWKDRD